MFNAVSNYLQKYATHKTRTVLMGMSDRQLEDAGISRHLLNGGVQNWPWKESAIVIASSAVQQPIEQPSKAKRADINKAVKELSAMTDAQLRDIGLNRGSIRQAVKHGLPDRGQRSAA